MVLVLIIGDLHIPHRMHDLPLKFKKLLVPGKIQQILCTGNVCDKETYEYLRTISPDVHVVKGDYDYEYGVGAAGGSHSGNGGGIGIGGSGGSGGGAGGAGGYGGGGSFPSSITVMHNAIKLGVIHGHQCVPVGDLDSLSAIARQMDVDVLISGHTHTFQAIESDNRFFVNPGSATGAWSGAFTSDPTPSFALMDIQGNVVVTYVYQLIDGEVRVEKIEWRKEANMETGVAGGTAANGRSATMPQRIPSPPAGVHSSEGW